MESQRRAGSSPLGVAAHGAGDHPPSRLVPARPGRRGTCRSTGSCGGRRSRSSRISPRSSEIPPRRARRITAVVAHEIGHVLGLDHENRRCALMNSRLWADASAARALALPLPDARGRRHPRPRPPLRRPRAQRGPAFCAAEAAPAAPVAIAATTADPTRAAPRLLDDAGGHVAQARVLRRAGGARPAPTIPRRRPWPSPGSPGTAQSVDDSCRRRACTATRCRVGALGRPGRSRRSATTISAARRSRFDGA